MQSNKASLDNGIFFPSVNMHRGALTTFSAVSETQRYISQIAVNVDHYYSYVVTLAKRSIFSSGPVVHTAEDYSSFCSIGE